MAVTADSEKEKNLFPPVDRVKMAAPTRLYESIIADISDRISRGVLKPGDILPSERELAEQFQLSRIPVREALKILEFLGVISYVPGKGMYVQPLEVPALVSKIFFGLNTSSDNIRQLFEVRLLLETYAARYGAERRTEEDLEELRGAVEHMPGEEGAQIEESLRFHMGVIKTAHNDIITEFYKFLSTLLTEARERTHMEKRFASQPLYYHTEIFHAIEEKDSQRAADLMRDHLRMEMEYLDREDARTSLLDAASN